MKRTLLTLVALLLAPLAALHAAETDLRKPVRIETGLVEGVPNQENDVVAFKGIPYAAPPVGNLRWREPQPPAHWEGVRKADAFGASCPQPVGSGNPPYTKDLFGHREQSEDCLFLNVWTPAKSAADKLPVLFFIHGGSYTTGSGSGNILDGEALAGKSIIVVTVNFRLGIFAGMGHPQLNAESPHHVCGNYGLLDIIAALRWVQNNIGAFGGDPGKVTLAGQSSGASAVHYLTASPLAKGLFRAAIATSFSYDYLTKPHVIPFVRQKEQDGQKFAEAKNARSLGELRKIPAADLVAKDPAVASARIIHLGGGVATDGWAFLLEYPAALDSGSKDRLSLLKTPSASKPAGS
jgi:para-nitrobenzyl esterase